MPLKIFRALWFLSVIMLFATLLFGYAGWQESMIIQQEARNNISINRDMLFYVLMGIFLLANVLVYVISGIFRSREDLRAWFHGLMITVNIFFIIAISFIGLFNSSEKFDYNRIGFIVYGSFGLVILWAIAWPIYALFQKIFLKQVV